MTMPGIRHHRHTALMPVAAATWLLLISAAVVIDHVTLTHVAERLENSTRGVQVAVLEKRLAELSHQIEQNQQPDALPQNRYESERLALDQRLAAIEQALGNRPTAESLLPLQARIEQLETRLAADRRTPLTTTTTRPHISAPAKPKTTEPPFRVIGAELRAGERFLSILSSASDELSQVRLLRPGEAESGWRLETIEGSTATFRHGDETRRLAVPTR
jgi:hypothetical protein